MFEVLTVLHSLYWFLVTVFLSGYCKHRIPIYTKLPCLIFIKFICRIALNLFSLSLSLPPISKRVCFKRCLKKGMLPHTWRWKKNLEFDYFHSRCNSVLSPKLHCSWLLLEVHNKCQPRCNKLSLKSLWGCPLFKKFFMRVSMKPNQGRRLDLLRLPEEIMN